jgi:hypothetical protein
MSKTISAIFIKCMTTYHLGNRVCHRCQKPLNDFKARIKTSSGWRTKPSGGFAWNRRSVACPCPTSRPRSSTKSSSFGTARDVIESDVADGGYSTLVGVIFNAVVVGLKPRVEAIQRALVKGSQNPGKCCPFWIETHWRLCPLRQRIHPLHPLPAFIQPLETNTGSSFACNPLGPLSEIPTCG